MSRLIKKLIRIGLFVGLMFALSQPSPGRAATDCAAQTEIPLAECQALLSLYDGTNGTLWSDSPGNGWNQNNTPCSWTGVTCSSPPHHVTDILRPGMNLVGTLPSLDGLPQLQQLDLSNNQLSGAIPSLDALTSLVKLDLSANQLSGAIPSLSAITPLTILNLSGNQLSGTLPSLSALIHLSLLDLSHNQLGGPIPSMSALVSLKTLYLSDNHLNSTIPVLSALTLLERLNLADNQLAGAFPDVGSLTHMMELNVDNNQLLGVIPTSLRYRDINLLGVSYNMLTASDIPLVQYLNQRDGDWEYTQTVPPTNPSAVALSANSVRVSWTLIYYTKDGGYYRAKYSKTSGGPYTPASGTTADKKATRYVVAGLSKNTPYYFVVEAYTPPHGSQQNALTSVNSAEVTATTTGTYYLYLPLVIK